MMKGLELEGGALHHVSSKMPTVRSKLQAVVRTRPPKNLRQGLERPLYPSQGRNCEIAVIAHPTTTRPLSSPLWPCLDSMSASPSATFVHKTLPNYKSEKWLQKYGWERYERLASVPFVRSSCSYPCRSPASILRHSEWFPYELHRYASH